MTDTMRVEVKCWRSDGFLRKSVRDEPHGDCGGENEKCNLER
ncbi:hypothetical protein A2U01_0077940 [Trifolium medium]|uniref:Uncharacterized protein n=1 Tax=Trifolium medium TaxID=97028 RepID=A0A392T6N1_9FABA|nr:hypothetical protein [Trifolium medium]